MFGSAASSFVGKFFLIRLIFLRGELHGYTVQQWLRSERLMDDGRECSEANAFVARIASLSENWRVQFPAKKSDGCVSRLVACSI